MDNDLTAHQMGSPENDLCVFIGRFQPFHSGHLAVIREGLERSKYICLLIGSSNAPRCHRNPFTYAERVSMVLNTIEPDDRTRVFTYPLEDSAYNDETWIESAQEGVGKALEFFGIDSASTISLIGHAKDAPTGYYLNMFPNWTNIGVSNYLGLSATPMREAYFSNIGHMWLADCDGHREGDLPRDGLVHPAVRDFLTTFMDTPDYKHIRNEFEHVQNYKKQWKEVPYEVIFQTIDACVVQSGHVLLVKRRAAPGKGLWALPGGFLNPRETLENGMIRELFEETQIDVTEEKIRSSIVMSRTFDDPNRSARGRTITQAYLVHLQRPKPRVIKKGKVPVIGLPKVVGSDDAEVAKWWPITEVRRDMMFEDHYDLIKTLTAIL